MRKTPALSICALAPLFALFAYFIRSREVVAIFDPTTGLALLWEGVSIILMLFSILVVALFFILSRCVPKEISPSFEKAFGTPSLFTGILSLLGLAITFLAAFALLRHVGVGDEANLFFVWAIGAFFSGICLSIFPILGARGKNVFLLAAMPVFWVCMWLVFSHIYYAADPVLIRYVYHLFAIAFLLLSLYYIASAAFGKGQGKRQIFSTALAVYFTGVSLADSRNFYQQVTMFLLAFFVLLYAILLLRHIGQNKEKNQNPPA